MWKGLTRYCTRLSPIVFIIGRVLYNRQMLMFLLSSRIDVRRRVPEWTVHPIKHDILVKSQECNLTG